MVDIFSLFFKLNCKKFGKHKYPTETLLNIKNLSNPVEVIISNKKKLLQHWKNARTKIKTVLDL